MSALVFTLPYFTLSLSFSINSLSLSFLSLCLSGRDVWGEAGLFASNGFLRWLGYTHCHTACQRMVCVSHGCSPLTAWPSIWLVHKDSSRCVSFSTSAVSEHPLWWIWIVFCSPCWWKTSLISFFVNVIVLFSAQFVNLCLNVWWLLPAADVMNRIWVCQVVFRDFKCAIIPTQAWTSHVSRSAWSIPICVCVFFFLQKNW